MTEFHPERYLKEFQMGIYNESLERFFTKQNNGFGLCIPLGGGKTFLTLSFAAMLKAKCIRRIKI